MPKQAFGLPAGAPEWEAFRKRMKAWRRKRGISQEEMALLMGRQVDNFQQIEKGHRMPQAQTILRFEALEERYRALEGLTFDAPEGLKRRGRR